MGRITRKQIEYLTLFEAGYSVSEIARMKGLNKSTVSRILQKARGKKCPFSTNCLYCPLEFCAIDSKYAVLINEGQSSKRNQKKDTFVEKLF